MRLPVITILSVLLIDQVSKIWVKTSMLYGESIPVFKNWFFIHFIENPGMAFGMQFGGNTGKIALTVFRIALVIAIGFYLVHLSKRKKSKPGLLVSISLIFSGALGNIIDSVWYGTIFTESTPFQKAAMFPSGDGYAPLLQGKVVDMLYFPLIETRLPDWLPFFGGDMFTFFDPVFNIADSAITIGISMLLLFQKRYFK